MRRQGTSDPIRVLSFRMQLSRRRLLEAIQSQRGHGSLGETLREAADEYIVRHLGVGLGGDEQRPTMRRDAAARKETLAPAA